VAEMMITAREIIVSTTEMNASPTKNAVRMPAMIISECEIMVSGSEMIKSAFEMIISVTDTMIKIGCRNKVYIINRLTVVVDHGLCDANDHFVDEEDCRSDEEDGRSHEGRGFDDGDDHFCGEEDRVGRGSDLRRRKDPGIRDTNHHLGSEQDALGLQEGALCPADHAVRNLNADLRGRALAQICARGPQRLFSAGPRLSAFIRVSTEKPIVGLYLSNIVGTCKKGIRLANIRNVVLRGEERLVNVDPDNVLCEAETRLQPD
jgi:hypothetical protein